VKCVVGAAFLVEHEFDAVTDLKCGVVSLHLSGGFVEELFLCERGDE
jgi:hypothetical protein